MSTCSRRLSLSKHDVRAYVLATMCLVKSYNTYKSLIDAQLWCIEGRLTPNKEHCRQSLAHLFYRIEKRARCTIVLTNHENLVR